jgi:hypothetical protein
MQIFYHHAPWYDKNNEAYSIVVYLANIFSKLAGYPSHPQEKKIELEAFVKSSEMEFIVKSGFDLDQNTTEKLVGHVEEYVLEEAENMMRFFD